MPLTQVAGSAGWSHLEKKEKSFEATEPEAQVNVVRHDEEDTVTKLIQSIKRMAIRTYRGDRRRFTAEFCAAVEELIRTLQQDRRLEIQNNLEVAELQGEVNIIKLKLIKLRTKKLEKEEKIFKKKVRVVMRVIRDLKENERLQEERERKWNEEHGEDVMEPNDEEANDANDQER